MKLYDLVRYSKLELKSYDDLDLDLGVKERLMMQASFSGATVSPFSLICNLPSEINSALLKDAIKFILASSQSYHRSRLPMKDEGYAWQVIESYYAGFFAAHAILRMCCRSVIYLSGSESSQLKNVFTACGQPAVTLKRSCITKFEASTNAIEISETSADAHNQLWKSFATLLADSVVSSETSVMPDVERQELKSLATKLESFFSLGLGGPSNIRNEVNYKFSHGVWLPLAKPHRSASLHLTASEDDCYRRLDTAKEAVSSIHVLSAILLGTSLQLAGDLGGKNDQFQREYSKRALKQIREHRLMLPVKI